MKKFLLTLVLIGFTFLLKAQKLQPLSTDSLSNKIVTGLAIGPKSTLQFFQPQLSITHTIKDLSAKSLFSANEVKDRMPVARPEGNSKMPVAKLYGYDHMPISYIDVTDPASTGSTNKAAKTPL